MKGTGAKIAAPEAERDLFARPLDFRKMDVRLGDLFTIHGSSYVRPPIEPIPLDRTFGTNDTFTWRGVEGEPKAWIVSFSTADVPTPRRT